MSNSIVIHPASGGVRSPHWRASSHLRMARNYGCCCQPQRQSVHEAWSNVREAIPTSFGDRRSPVRIAHLGAAPNGSLASLRRLNQAVLVRNFGRAIEVIHVDLPGTDFRPLFHEVNACGNAAGETSGGRIFHRAVGASFWNPLFPRHSVDMAVCHMAAHWLSGELAGRASEESEMSGDCPASPARRVRLDAEMARADWSHFWHARAKELRPGGTVWLTMLGREVGTHSADHLPVQLLKAAAREAASQGLVSVSAAESFVVPVYRRTVEETLQPFREPSLSDVFHVESVMYRESSCPLVSRWCQHRDDARFAREVARFIRGFSEWVVTRQLFGDRSRAEQRAAVVRFYALVEQQVRVLNRPLGLFRRGVITLVARRSWSAV